MRLLIVILLVCSLNIWGQDAHTQYDGVNHLNVPDELRNCLRNHPELEINGNINPFYLGGDFDGDGTTDFVVQVRNAKKNIQGILICFADSRNVQWGAGAPNDVLEKNNWPFNSWLLIRKGSKHLSVYPQIRTDVIALIIADEGGGLLYWDGKKFRWKQEE